MKKYQFGFDIWALVLFLLVMIPNFFWFAIPAPNDVLRLESVTPIVDSVGSIFQIIMVAALCMIVRSEKSKFALWQKISLAICVCLYYAGWAAYYFGVTNVVVILDLCVAPCCAFFIFSIARKNPIAILSGVIFAICHVYFAVVNFIV